MSSTPASTTSRSRQTQSKTATGASSRSRKLSAYGKNFQEHLNDHNVYMNSQKSRPNNAKAIQSELAKERASLSPSKFSEGAFESFQRESEEVAFESDVMTMLFPRLRGTSDILSKQNVLFTEPKPITDDNAVKPKPDVFDGARLQDLSKELKADEDLRSTVIPTKHPSVPVAPNFFLEAKGPDGNAAVAQRQACYDGAYGVRAIHDLQNYRETEPAYDGNAYTFSSTFHASTGTLQLYSHHVTAPTTNGLPEYHMMKLRGFNMTDTRDTFVAGATAFRNARDLAKRHRDAFIQAANTRAARMSAMDPADVTGAYQEIPAPALHETRESVDLSGDGAWQDADGALQQLMADGDDGPLQGETTVIPRYLRAEEDSQKPGQESGRLEGDDPSLSFASSFTSFETETLRSKRPRQSLSPPTKPKRTLPCMSGTGADKGPRITQSSAPTASMQSDSSESRWVETYARKGKVRFKTP